MYLIKKNGGTVGFPVFIEDGSFLEGNNRIGNNSRFKGDMGYGSYISDNCTINADIGRFSCIAGNVKTLSGTHPFQAPYATVSPLFYSKNSITGNSFTKDNLFDELRYYDKTRKIGVKIGNDCWIGENATIIGGCEIGDGAVVLAGAMVTKNVPPYSIVGGVPAKVLRFRYDEDTISTLIKMEWWNKDIDWLKANHLLLCNIDELKKFVIARKNNVK